jgi:O-antigen/teichoic acid export membrane protein
MVGTVKGVRGLVGRFLSILGGKVLTTIVAIASTPIIVRLLGPGSFGDYAFLLSIYSLYMIPVSGAITEGVQKFVAETRDLDHWRERVLRFYGILAVVLVAATLLVAVTSLGVVESLFGTEYRAYFYLLSAFVLVGQFRALSYHTVLGLGLEPVSESLNVVKKITTVGLGIGLLTVGFGVTGMLLGHIVAEIVVAVVAGAVILRRLSVGALLTGSDEPFPHRELLSFNALNIVLVLTILSLFHVDVIMLRTMVGDETTGFYKAALAMAEYVWIVPIALQVLLLHSSSTLWSEGRHEEITELASRVTRYSVLLVLLMAIGLAAVANRVVPLYYGAEFAVATLPLLLLLPGTVGFAAARPIQAISQGSGEITTLVVATGGAATLNLGLNALLIPRFGMPGAAVATSVGYGSMFGFLVWAAWRIGYNPLSDFRGFRIAATVVLAAPPIVLLARSSPSDLVALTVTPPLGALLFCGIAIGTGALDREEILDVLGQLPEPLSGVVESGRSWVERF